MVPGSLKTYRKKRDFARTAEPAGKVKGGRGGRFVLHEHHASRLHFDLRLEMGGVLKSWAVPKGPSLDPKDRRLAVQTEDHPVQYLTFKGSIADGQYGAGEMRIWDAGTFSLTKGGEPLEAWEQGRLHIDLEGGKLHGSFMLVRTARDERQWLFFKIRDEAAVADWTPALILPYGSHKEKPGNLEETEAKPTRARARAGKAKSGRAAKPPGLKSTGGKSPKARPTAPRKGPPGAVPAPLPKFVEPMLATLVDEPFDDKDWVFETKWDGWRALLRFDGKGMSLTSRSGRSLDAMFPELMTLHERLKAQDGLIDGEVVALDEQGRSRFQLLQNRLKGKKSGGEGQIVFYAFDLLHYDGHDLTACTLTERKSFLRKILPSSRSGALRYSDHFAGRGKEVFRHAVRLGFEGVVAKHRNSPYVKGRSEDWLKVKVKKRQEVVIAGMTEPRGSRPYFGSLVAGLYQGGKLVFAGHVGGGFDARMLKEVHGLLAPLRIAKSPFAKVPKTNEKVEWLKPLKVGEVEFAEWTGDGRMRQPIFMGLRPDKDPRDCVREEEQATVKAKEKAEADLASIPEPATAAATTPMTNPADTRPGLTNLDKVYWPDDGYTKGDLIRYYESVAPWILPHLKDRPLILKRFPNGIGSPPFFQHDLKNPPPFMKTVIEKDDDGSAVHYALCQNRESLLYLANLGVIPMHPWLSRIPHLDRPDWIVFDLDPQEVPFPEVGKMATFLGGLLESLGLTAFPKTSGSRGIHLYLPLKPAYTFGQSLDFAQLVAEWAVQQMPDAFTMERSLKIRKRDRIYLDCMQNSRGKSVASAYSVRERPGASVSAPLEWSELKGKIRMEDFDIRTMPKRLAKKGDLFQSVLKVRNSLEGALKKLERVLQE